MGSEAKPAVTQHADSDLRTTSSFSWESQRRFAELSGDWNPIHINPLAARRTSAGRPVVHGMHLVLAALEQAAAQFGSLPALRTLSARFQKPIYVDEQLALEWSKDSDNVTIRARIDDAILAEIRLHLGDSPARQEQAHVAPDDGAASACRELSLEEMAGRSGIVRPAATADALQLQFPRAAMWIGVHRVAGLLCVSRLVGMECPGLHSLLSAVDIELSSTNTSPVLAYKVESIDPRFRQLRIGVSGLGLEGQVKAFARLPSTSQASMQELSTRVGPHEFQGQRALVVGGSRGLGELTAKIIAAGGGVPVITYAAGEADAERVVEEITASGGRCERRKYDIASPAEEQLATLSAPVSHAYYFASCQIFRRRTQAFSRELLDEFMAYYVDGFYRLCTALRAASPSACGVLSLFDRAGRAPTRHDRVRMAKVAGEILCADLSRVWPDVRIFVRRLPRVPTDQTSSLVPVKSADPLQVMLPIVREVQESK